MINARNFYFISILFFPFLTFADVGITTTENAIVGYQHFGGPSQVTAPYFDSYIFNGGLEDLTSFAWAGTESHNDANNKVDIEVFCYDNVSDLDSAIVCDPITNAIDSSGRVMFEVSPSVYSGELAFGRNADFVFGPPIDVPGAFLAGNVSERSNSFAPLQYFDGSAYNNSPVITTSDLQDNIGSLLNYYTFNFPLHPFYVFDTSKVYVIVWTPGGNSSGYYNFWGAVDVDSRIASRITFQFTSSQQQTSTSTVNYATTTFDLSTNGGFALIDFATTSTSTTLNYLDNSDALCASISTNLPFYLSSVTDPIVTGLCYVFVGLFYPSNFGFATFQEQLDNLQSIPPFSFFFTVWQTRKDHLDNIDNPLSRSGVITVNFPGTTNEIDIIDFVQFTSSFNTLTGTSIIKANETPMDYIEYMIFIFLGFWGYAYLFRVGRWVTGVPDLSPNTTDREHLRSSNT